MASVLKQHGQGQPGGQVPTPVAFNMQDVQSRARDYLAEIQKQADELLAAAQVEAQRIRAEAEQQGKRDAQAMIEQQIQTAAQKLSDVRCRTAVAACEKTMRDLTEETTRWLATWRDNTITMAAQIAEKLVRREMARDNDELLHAWLEEALVAIRDDREVKVLVHPDDFSVAGRFIQQLAKSTPQAADCEVLPDPTISPGGCVVRSTHGRIDQQLEVQLDRLIQQLG